MELTYANIEAFMKKYFEYYNKYSQDEATIDKMDEFWGPEFQSTAYFYRSNGKWPLMHATGREFRDMICSAHKEMGELLNPVDMFIDERKKQVGVLLRIEKKLLKTGEKASFTAIALYKVMLTAKGTMSLRSLDICVDNPEGLTGMWKY